MSCTEHNRTHREPQPDTKEYLGDGVYVDLDEWGAIILTTENGLKITNRIVLEPIVCQALKEYVDRKAGRRNG